MAHLFRIPFRRIIFWLHLITGLIAGVVLFVVCLTAALFFVAHEIGHLAEDKYLHVTPGEGSLLSPDEILAKAQAAFLGKKATQIEIASEADHAAQVRFGRELTAFVNPYTGETQTPETDGWHRTFSQWTLNLHRHLAFPGEAQPYGKHLVNIATIIMIFLAVSGLWLWWPRHWSWRAFKSSTWFIRGAKGKTRDWNWHNVFGFWTLPLMIVLSVSGIVLGYEWATDLTYRVAGDPLPERKRGRPQPNPVPDLDITKPSTHATRATLTTIFEEVEKSYPDWDSVVFQVAAAAPRGGRASPASAANSETTPVKVTVNGTGRWLPMYDYADLSVHPYTGKILHAQTFEDIPRGGRWKIWLRWLHTGMAFGFVGELIAALVSLAGCVLVWTGFALTWRRFFKKKKTTPTPSR